MNRSIKKMGFICLTLLAISVAMLVCPLFAQNKISEVNVLDCLPTASDLPDFKMDAAHHQTLRPVDFRPDRQRRMRSLTSPLKRTAFAVEITSLNAQRTTDSAQVYVEITTAPNVENAIEMMNIILSTNYSSGVPKEDTTGKRLGEKVWRSHPKGKQKGGSYSVTVLDGRSIIKVQMTRGTTRRVNGVPAFRPFSQGDIAKVESLAEACLNRLADKGYTSR